MHPTLFAALFALGISLGSTFTPQDMKGVTISSEVTPFGGIACHAMFRGVPGNAQAWCPDHGEAGHIVFSDPYTPACIHDAIDTGRKANRYCVAAQTVTYILAHELAHLVIGVDHDHADPFREDLAHQAGLCAAYGTQCDWRDRIPPRGAR